ncbi:MAG: hypothetical protein JSW11_19320 [Candidatus Heimdallarchaeota archaeon]|nr:MAG: hypothetical protein JSW11_19320 [Candidatus Heimdallarchaeota archaeon]
MRYGDLSAFTDIDQSNIDDSYGFFLYFFDEVQGHVPLFSYPKQLLNNKNEKEIISIHSIWWHQDRFLETDKFISIDLELGGVIYCGTLILCETRRIKRREGMESKKWQAERFVLIVKAPSTVSFIAQEILHELKTRIQGSIGENLCFLVELHLKKQENSDVEEFLKKKSDDIEHELIRLCISLIPKMPITKLEGQLEESVIGDTNGASTTPTHESQIQKPAKKPRLRFSIPTSHKHEISKEKPDVTLAPEPKRVRVTNIKHSEDDKRVQVTVRNSSSNLIVNALLKIYESQGFFGKDILISEIKEWAPNQDVLIEFELADSSGIIYFLKVEDEKGTIRVKRIIG